MTRFLLVVVLSFTFLTYFHKGYAQGETEPGRMDSNSMKADQETQEYERSKVTIFN